jgi:hypothetical protein
MRPVKSWAEELGAELGALERGAVEPGRVRIVQPSFRIDWDRYRESAAKGGRKGGATRKAGYARKRGV